MSRKVDQGTKKVSFDGPETGGTWYFSTDSERYFVRKQHQFTNVFQQWLAIDWQILLTILCMKV